MRLLVCFKTGPDLRKVVESDWCDFSLNTELSYAGRILGCFDESALELALRVKDNSDVECTAVTVGPVPPKTLWQTLFAAGIDRMVIIETESSEFRPDYVAQELACFALCGEYDLILTGRQAGLADTATVPFHLANHLDIPIVTEVETIAEVGGCFSLQRAADGGRERLLVRSPILVTVGNSPDTSLRAVTLKARLAAAKRNLEILPPTSKIENGISPVIFYELKECGCSFLKEDNLSLLAEIVISRYLNT